VYIHPGSEAINYPLAGAISRETWCFAGYRRGIENLGVVIQIRVRKRPCRPSASKNRVRDAVAMRLMGDRIALFGHLDVNGMKVHSCRVRRYSAPTRKIRRTNEQCPLTVRIYPNDERHKP
jgi:hypothetical protein